MENRGAFWLSSAMGSSLRKRNGGRGRETRRRAEPAGLPGRRLWRDGEERLEAAGAVERDQVVAAADVGIADEDLRHGVAAGELDHGRALGGALVDPDLVELLDPALAQQRLGPDAVGAGGSAVHLHRLQGRAHAKAGEAACSLMRKRP